MACINIPILIKESIGEGATVDYSGECSTECIPMWRDSGPAVCINGESKIPQIDGCGNSRMVLGGEACCIPDWAPTGKEKCENAISFREEFDGCGEYRWVQGGSACCIPEWVMTPTARCLDGVSQQLWVDGCSASEWRPGGNACPPPVPVVPLEKTGVYNVTFYAPPIDGYWNYPENCDFISKYKVRVDWWETSPYSANIKQFALQEAKITLRESWVNGAPYFGNDWPASAGALKILRFDINGTGPEVGHLFAETVGGIVNVFIQFWSWRKLDNTIIWCNGASTTLTFPSTASTDTSYLGMHSLVFPPQSNGGDYRAAPFMSNLWKDAEGFHFVSLDDMYRDSSWGQAVGFLSTQAAAIPGVSDMAFGTCGIPPSLNVLEFDATCLIPAGGA